jgi:O-antigen ligase
MRFVALAVILITLPLFVALLNRYRDRREWALIALGVMLFLHGTLQIDAAILSWRLWPGIAKGIMLSPMDTLSLALILTRAAARSRVPYVGLTVLYLLPSTLSIFISFNATATLFIPMQILRVAIMFVAIAGEVHRPSALRGLFGGVAIGLVMQGAFVVNEKLSGVVQAKGSMPHQNILGIMAELSLIPLLAMVLEGDRRKIMYAGIIAGLIIVAGGGSRATMGFTGVGLGLLISLSLARRITPRKIKILGFAVLAAILIVPLGFGTLKERFGEAGLTFESDEQRPAFERAANAISDDYPFGIGANNYVAVANSGGYSQRAGVSWGGNNLAAPVHNAYLLMRAETGRFGEMVMLILLIAPVIGGVRVAFSDRKAPNLGMGLATSTACFIAALHCLYEYAWHIEAVQRIFFTNLAVLSGCILWNRAAKRSLFKRRRQLAAEKMAAAA